MPLCANMYDRTMWSTCHFSFLTKRVIYERGKSRKNSDNQLTISLSRRKVESHAANVQIFRAQIHWKQYQTRLYSLFEIQEVYSFKWKIKHCKKCCKLWILECNRVVSFRHLLREINTMAQRNAEYPMREWTKPVNIWIHFKIFLEMWIGFDTRTFGVKVVYGN